MPSVQSRLPQRRMVLQLDFVSIFSRSIVLMIKSSNQTAWPLPIARSSSWSLATLALSSLRPREKLWLRSNQIKPVKTNRKEAGEDISANANRTNKSKPSKTEFPNDDLHAEGNETVKFKSKKQPKAKPNESNDNRNEESDSSEQESPQAELELMGQQIHKIPIGKKGRRQNNKKNTNQRRAA